MLTAFRHHAHPYDGRAEFATSCAEVVRAGLDRDERPMVLARSESIVDVRDALGELSAAVSFVPIDEHARNPSRLVTMLHTFAARPSDVPQSHAANGHADTGRFLGVCENALGGCTSAQLAEILLSECVLNTAAFAQLPLSVVCLYDDDELDDTTSSHMRRSHPTVHGLAANPDFDEALATVLHAAPLEPPPDAVQELVVGLDDLASVRAIVKSYALDHGVAPDRADDLVLAANEIVTNSLRYGGGRAHVQVWSDGDAVVFQSRDHGYLRDPLTGRLAPRPDANSGRGLWLAHHLCDLVQLRSAESGGTTVRLFVDR